MTQHSLLMMKKLFTTLLIIIATILGVHETYAQASELLILEIEGAVTPAMVSYFRRGIETAESDGSAAILIILDTPGGNTDPTQEIIQLFRNAKVPIIVYISPSGAQAASAGSIITIAAHFSGMAPGTVIGAASPVGEGGADLDETIFRKLTEDFSAQIRSMTQRRGEEATALAEAMIMEAQAVNAQEALEVGLIDAVAIDVDDLLRQLDGKRIPIDGQNNTLRVANAERQTFSMNLTERVLHALSNPLFVSILLVIGVQAILIELSSPGGWVAGFIGVMSLGLALYGLGQLPANWFGLGMIAVAFVLLALEVKAPTHGALAVAGTITMIAGLLVLFNSPSNPEFARISVPGAIGIGLITAAFFVFIVTMAVKAQQRTPITGFESLIGKPGLVRTSLKTDGPPYTGMILINGTLWRATADEPIEKGEKAVVKEVKGYTLQVSKSDEK